MVRAILSSEFDYVLQRERKLPKEEQTVFHLRKLSARERFKLEDETGSMDQRGSFTAHVGWVTEQSLLAGLLGWTNMKGEKPGDPDVEFKKSSKMLNVLSRDTYPPAPEMLDLLHPNDATELANAIQAGASLSVEEAGN